jgi:hypothetical protein
MSEKKFTPTISKREFDAIASELRADLERKYIASKSDAERPRQIPQRKERSITCLISTRRPSQRGPPQ